MCRPHRAVVPLCARKRVLEQQTRAKIAATKKILDLVIVGFRDCVVCCVGQHIVLFHSRQATIRAQTVPAMSIDVVPLGKEFNQ